MIEEGNQSDISTLRTNYERIKEIRGTIVIEDSEYIELLEKLACYEKKQLLNYNEALLLQEEVLELKKQVYPENDQKIADTLIEIGLICFKLSIENKGKRRYKQSKRILRESVGNV